MGNNTSKNYEESSSYNPLSKDYDAQFNEYIDKFLEQMVLSKKKKMDSKSNNKFFGKNSKKNQIDDDDQQSCQCIKNCFKVCRGRPYKLTWKQYLIQKCNQIVTEYQWPKLILKQIEKCQVTKSNQYICEIIFALQNQNGQIQIPQNSKDQQFTTIKEERSNSNKKIKRRTKSNELSNADQLSNSSDSSYSEQQQNSKSIQIQQQEKTDIIQQQPNNSVKDIDESEFFNQILQDENTPLEDERDQQQQQINPIEQKFVSDISSIANKSKEHNVKVQIIKNGMSFHYKDMQEDNSFKNNTILFPDRIMKEFDSFNAEEALIQNQNQQQNQPQNLQQIQIQAQLKPHNNDQIQTTINTKDMQIQSEQQKVINSYKERQLNDSVAANIITTLQQSQTIQESNNLNINDDGGISMSNTGKGLTKKAFFQKELKKYKIITKIIQDHIFYQKENPMYQIRQMYIEQFYNNYYEFLNKNEYSQHYFNTITEDFNIFINIFTKAVILFYREAFFSISDQQYMSTYKYQKKHIKKISDTNKFKRKVIQNLYSKINLRQFVTNIMFDSEEVYQILFGLQEKIDAPRQRKMKNILMKIEGLQKREPQLFGVQPQFCLNQFTINFLKKENMFEKQHIISEHDHKSSSQSRSINININNSFTKKTQMKSINVTNTSYTNKNNNNKNFKSASHLPPITTAPLPNSNEKQQSQQDKQQNLLLDQNQQNNNIITSSHSNFEQDYKEIQELIFQPQLSDYYQNSFISQLCQQPYQNAIDYLQKIQATKSPIHKLQKLMSLGMFIRECIYVFYQQIGVCVTCNFDVHDDDIITIIIYIIVKSGIKNLISHCNFIEKFMNIDFLNYNSDYSYFTFRSCVDYIENFST